jgi:ABC-type uncharacterized transport system permease subunit
MYSDFCEVQEQGEAFFSYPQAVSPFAGVNKAFAFTHTFGCVGQEIPNANKIYFSSSF